MTVNVEFLKLLIENEPKSYSEGLQLSKDNGFGEIPFGEYCLAVGIVEYHKNKNISLESCIKALKKYIEPSVFDSVPGSIPTGVKSDPAHNCGGCGSDIPPFPGSLDMALSAGLALARWISSGGKNVSKEERGRRLAACGPCAMRDNARCRKCGCFIKVKSWMATEECPEGRWNSASI